MKLYQIKPWRFISGPFNALTNYTSICLWRHSFFSRLPILMFQVIFQMALVHGKCSRNGFSVPTKTTTAPLNKSGINELFLVKHGLSALSQCVLIDTMFMVHNTGVINSAFNLEGKIVHK